MKHIQPEQFENQVYAALKSAFSTVIGANLEKRFYTFGLFSDDSLQFLHPVANTEEALSATVARYRKTVDPKVGDLPVDLVNTWVSALNPPEVAEQFMNWDCNALDEGSDTHKG